MEKSGNVSHGSTTSGASDITVNVSRTPLSRDTVLSRFPEGSVVSARVVQTVRDHVYVANFQGLNLLAESEIPFKNGDFIFGKVISNQPGRAGRQSHIHLRWLTTPLAGRAALDEQIDQFLREHKLDISGPVRDLIKALLEKKIPLDPVALRNTLAHYTGGPADPQVMVYHYLLSTLKREIPGFDRFINAYINKPEKRLRPKTGLAPLPAGSHGAPAGELPDLKAAVESLLTDKDPVFMLKTMARLIGNEAIQEQIAGNRLAAALDQDLPLIIPFVAADGETRFVSVKFQKGLPDRDRAEARVSGDRLTLTIPFERLGMVQIEMLKMNQEIFVRLVFDDEAALALVNQAAPTLKRELMTDQPLISDVVIMSRRQLPAPAGSAAGKGNLDLWI